MGVYNFNNEEHDFLKDPIYIEPNPLNFAKTFNNHINNIQDIGLKVLKRSIEEQEKKEEYIYDALEIKNHDWKEIGKIIYSFSGEENEKEAENKLAFMMNQLVDYINIGILDGSKFTAKYKGQDFIKEKGEDNFKELMRRYIEFYNDPVESFWNWYKSSGIIEGKIKKEDMNFLKSNVEALRKSEKTFKEGEYWDLNKILSSIDECNRLINKSQGIISNAFGGIKEACLVSIMQNTEKVIDVECTSYFENNNNNNVNFLEQNKKYYEILQDKINNYLKENNYSLITEDGNFSFGSSLDKNLKADDLFKININIGKAKKVNIPILYGISSKASWGESVTNPKIYDGSFQSLFINMFKMRSSIEDTVKISNFVQYATYNSLGSIYDAQNRYFDRLGIRYYTETKNLFEKMIYYYGYQWLIGGTSPYTHSDFFSVYKATSREHYFIPMSLILNLALNWLLGKNDKSVFSQSGLFPEAEEKKTKKEGKNIIVPGKKLSKIDIQKAQNNKKETLKIINGIISGVKGSINLQWSAIETGILS